MKVSAHLAKGLFTSTFLIPSGLHSGEIMQLPLFSPSVCYAEAPVPVVALVHPMQVLPNNAQILSENIHWDRPSSPHSKALYDAFSGGARTKAAARGGAVPRQRHHDVCRRDAVQALNRAGASR